MSLQSRLDAFITAVGADIKALQDSSGGGGGGGTAISALPTAGALDGTELIAVVQAGTTEKTTVAQVRPWNEQVLTSTYTNATLTATDVFTGFTPVANTRYLVDALLSGFSNAPTTGIQTGIAGPSTGITRAAVKVISSSNANADVISHIGLNAFQGSTQVAGVPALISIQSIIEVGATPGAGNIRMQAKSEVAIANAVLFYPGSSMRWRVI